ncbi:MAG TPA: DMT family transporter [Beijerinckiaceae bacterium]|nr:DMT family transporter [Beijerinckiaceae bacterium]
MHGPSVPIPHPYPVNPLLGIILKIASTLVFSMMGASIKFVGTRYPTGEIMFFRAFFTLIPLMSWLAYRQEISTVYKTSHFWGHVRRNLVGATGMFCGFVGLTNLPLPDATAIGYAGPLLTVVFAAVLLKEVVRAYRWSAVLIGLVGVVLMLLPHMSSSLITEARNGGPALGALASLGGAACTAFAVIEVRRLSQSETTATIVFYFSIVCSALALLSLFWGWRMPSLGDGVILVATGIFGGMGQILLTASYRHAGVSTLAPFDYTSMIWALTLGYLLFGERPLEIVLAGAAVVISAGLFVIWREHQLGLVRRVEEKTARPRVA